MELWANQKNGYENKIWRSFDWNFFFLHFFQKNAECYSSSRR